MNLDAMKRAAWLLAALLLAAACGATSPVIELVPQPPQSPAAVKEKSVASPSARVTVAGGPVTHPAMSAAVAEIKRLRLWRAMTSHLTRLHIRARPGRSAVPQDRHLADSLYRPTRDAEGRFCRITFYPRAMRDDLARQRFYFSEGRLPAKPPTMGQFWVAILAHELAHCRDHMRTEKAALRVEHRVLERLRAR
ncbi:MAG: hypothetical protein M3454_02100 [Actinomycetota bacterium]|nr:hypothetical protein [Actinomycetota bacterium]